MPTNNLKHIGQLVNTQKRCVVVFREIPDEPHNCLVVDTDALPDWIHDDVINAVESPGAQAEANFYEYCQRTLLSDGSNMLTSLHISGRLMKTPTDNVMMVPNRSTSIPLSELNELIRQNNGDAPAVKKPDDELEMAKKDVSETPSATPTAAPVQEETLDGEALAKNLLAQAESFEAEAKALREQAYEMEPSLKPRRGRPSKKQQAANAD